MKRMIYGAALLLAAVGTGCEKNDPNGESGTPATPGDSRISFTTSIAATRAPQLDEDGSGMFSADDIFTLYAYDAAGHAFVTDYTVGSSELYWRDLTFADEGGKVSFAACYPQQQLSDGSFGFTIRQTAGDDLLIASAEDVAVGTGKNVPLLFRHAMHRLNVKISVKDPEVEASKIETFCTGYYTCTVDLAADRIERGDSKKEFSAEGTEMSFYLVPQAAEEVSLRVKVGEIERQWTIQGLDPTCGTLEGGKVLTVTLTIQDGTIRFDGMTIGAWEDQGSIDGEIIL